MRRKYKTKPDVEDWVPHTCQTCRFAFPSSEEEDQRRICAAHNSLYGYGGVIKDLLATCDQWILSLEAFSEERDRYYNRK